MPTVAITNWMKKVNKNAFSAFLAAVIAGLITHLFIMTNKVFNYNEFSVLFLDKEEMTLGRMAEGRWFVGVIGHLIGDNYSMQMVTGVIGILLIGVSAAMVVSILSMKKRLYAILTGCCMVVFPALSSFMAFTQLGDAWFFSVFLAIAAVYLTEKTKWGHFAGLIMIGLSLAIHQAYVSVTIAFMFLVIFKEVYENDKTLKELLPRIGKYLIILVGGFIFYYIGVKVCAAIFDYSLSSYHGIDEMTSFTPKGIAKGIVYAYLYFLEYFFTTKYLFTYVWVVVDVLLALCLIMYLVRTIADGFKTGKKGNAFLRIFLFAVLPLGMNGLPVLLADRVGAGVDRYMMYSLVFLWVLLLYVADRMEQAYAENAVSDADRLENPKAAGNQYVCKVCLWIITIGVIFHIGHDYEINNQSYYRAHAATEQTTSYLNRVAARIEATEGWSAETPVHFVTDGELFGSYSVTLPEFDNLREMRGTAYEPNYGEGAIARFMQYYLHFPVTLATEEQVQALEQNTEYQSMEMYPETDSIQLIDGVLVVKFSDVEE